jgi:glycosyltransferase 2 family protein
MTEDMAARRQTSVAQAGIGKVHRLGLAVKTAISVGLIVLVLRKIDFATLWTESRQLSVSLILGVVLTLLVQTYIAAYRWWVIMRHHQLDIRLLTTVRISFIGAFFNQLLPSSIGGDVARAWYVYCKGYSRGISVVSVISDRIYGMLLLVCLAIILFPVLVYFSISTEALIAFGGLISAALLALLVAFWLDGLPGRLQRRTLIRHLATLSAATRAIARDKWTSAPVLGLSLLVHVITIVTMLLLLSAVAPQHNLLLCAALVPLITLIAMVPVSIAGWGVREGVMVYGLGLAHVPKEAALIVSILFGLSLAAVGVVGGLIWVVENNHATPRHPVA